MGASWLPLHLGWATLGAGKSLQALSGEWEAARWADGA